MVKCLLCIRKFIMENLEKFLSELKEKEKKQVEKNKQFQLEREAKENDFKTKFTSAKNRIIEPSLKKALSLLHPPFKVQQLDTAFEFFPSIAYKINYYNKSTQFFNNRQFCSSESFYSCR